MRRERLLDSEYGPAPCRARRAWISVRNSRILTRTESIAINGEILIFAPFSRALPGNAFWPYIEGMSDSRPPIPAPLERSLMIEAGYRCAVCKTTEPLQIDHIIEWATVRKHEFENMIVLCANCHARKKNTSDPRHINRSSLRQIKSSLMLLNGRYSDLERRIIDVFKDELAARPGITPSVFIPERLHLLVRYLIQDGMIEAHCYQSGLSNSFEDGTILRDDTLKLLLTLKGRQFIEHLYPSMV